jgi:hypothetical protein
MTPEHHLYPQTAGWLPEREQPLLRMRAWYRQTADIFSTAELARLRFLRWLYRTGQLDASGD